MGWKPVYLRVFVWRRMLKPERMLSVASEWWTRWGGWGKESDKILIGEKDKGWMASSFQLWVRDDVWEKVSWNFCSSVFRLTWKNSRVVEIRINTCLLWVISDHHIHSTDTDQVEVRICKWSLLLQIWNIYEEKWEGEILSVVCVLW